MDAVAGGRVRVETRLAADVDLIDEALVRAQATKGEEGQSASSSGGAVSSSSRGRIYRG